MTDCQRFFVQSGRYNPSMKIYIVTSGDYSDYGVDAVFSTKEKADAYVATARANGDFSCCVNNPDEWELDAIPLESIKSMWTVNCDLGDGSLDEPIGPTAEVVSDGSRGDADIFAPWRAVGRSYVSAEHAKKLAVEARQKWLREQANHATTRQP